METQTQTKKKMSELFSNYNWQRCYMPEKWQATKLSKLSRQEIIDYLLKWNYDSLIKAARTDRDDVLKFVEILTDSFMKKQAILKKQAEEHFQNSLWLVKNKLEEIMDGTERNLRHDRMFKNNGREDSWGSGFVELVNMSVNALEGILKYKEFPRPLALSLRKSLNLKKVPLTKTCFHHTCKKIKKTDFFSFEGFEYNETTQEIIDKYLARRVDKVLIYDYI